MMNTKILLLTLLSLLSSTHAFTTLPTKKSPFVTTTTKKTSLSATKTTKQFNPIPTILPVLLTTAAPLIARAADVVDADDGYVYGAVDAPISIAWVGGVFIILTALLPLALRGGEEAFNEMKERDEDKWGSGNSDALNRRK